VPYTAPATPPTNASLVGYFHTDLLILYSTGENDVTLLYMVVWLGDTARTPLQPHARRGEKFAKDGKNATTLFTHRTRAYRASATLQALRTFFPSSPHYGLHNHGIRAALSCGRCDMRAGTSISIT